MEASVVERLARIDAAAFVIDCAPNMSDREITERTVPLVRTLRAARPHAAIVLVEDRRYSDGWIHAPRRERNELNARALRVAYQVLVAEGVERLAYVDAASLPGGSSADGLTDGSHPNDHGMLAYADALAPVLAALLGKAHV